MPEATLLGRCSKLRVCTGLRGLHSNARFSKGGTALTHKGKHVLVWCESRGYALCASHVCPALTLMLVCACDSVLHSACDSVLMHSMCAFSNAPPPALHPAAFSSASSLQFKLFPSAISSASSLHFKLYPGSFSSASSLQVKLFLVSFSSASSI